MATKRAHVVLPEELVTQIDRIVGSRGRSSFLAELARREHKRRHLLEVFKNEEPIWKEEDHPELKDGAADWVSKIRAESEGRFSATRDRD